jgi:CheY-like chemotaxis protein
LATAYSIIKKHDGYISVDSELNVGTTLSIYLPASKIICPIKIITEEKPILGKGKILLMDDEQEIRDIIGEMLKTIGYEKMLVKDGVEAIEMYKKEWESQIPFDAVIMDLTIPGGMGGKETIQKLRTINPKVKAIVSSGYSDDPVMTEPQRFGFCDVIKKPFNIAELSKKIHKMIEINR